MAFVIASGLSFAKPKEFIERDDLFYSTNEATTTISNEYMPIWVEEDPVKRADKLIERIDEDLVRVNKIYWPGWKIYIDGQTQPISYENKNGLMQISTKASLDKIRPVFSETPFRLFCDFWSLGTFFFLVYLYVKRQA